MTVGTDFLKGPIGDFGVTVSRTPVTTTTDFSGNKTHTDGEAADIVVVFENPNTGFTLDKPGLTKNYDAKIFIQPAQAMSKYDKITYDSKVYRVKTVSTRHFNGTAVFKTVTLYYLNDA